ncbi:MAG: hypothetical protein ACI4SE_06825 [Lachnospiraceae bacterium]
MKNTIGLWISLVLESVALMAMIINVFVVRFPDWAVRAIGICFLITVFTTAFFTKRVRMEKKGS